MNSLAPAELRRGPSRSPHRITVFCIHSESPGRTNAASVRGGDTHTASGFAASISGGDTNRASGLVASVCGGVGNTANSDWASVSGRDRNAASGDFASVSGGLGRSAPGFFDWAAGGLFQDFRSSRIRAGLSARRTLYSSR